MESLNVAVARIEEKLDNIHEQVNKLDRCLNGNGKKGLLEEFTMFKGAVIFSGFLLTIAISIVAIVK